MYDASTMNAVQTINAINTSSGINEANVFRLNGLYFVFANGVQAIAAMHNSSRLFLKKKIASLLMNADAAPNIIPRYFTAAERSVNAKKTQAMITTSIV